MQRKILILELWGIGDLTLASGFLHQSLEAGWQPYLLAKEAARALLQPSFPAARFLAWEAPWTRFYGKYRLWNWDWRALATLVRALRQEHFAAAVSVRPDPRDHLLMALSGARRRFGFSTKGSGVFLTDALPRPHQHRVEDWSALASSCGFPGLAAPRLTPAAYPFKEMALPGKKPLICLHTGARIPVRRWPERYFAETLARMRAAFEFELLLIPDPDGYGRSLAPWADAVAENLTLPELVALLGRGDLLFCNDSGPAHLAAACGKPVLALFGPTDPVVFRPWGETCKVLIRDLCPHRPCRDACRLPRSICLEALTPELLWEEISVHLRRFITTKEKPSAVL